MASICLYDIDFHHSQGFSPPNLELMKVFNYYYQNNDIVCFGRPGEDLRRYNQIIYFKANPNTKIPKSIELSGENIQIYGYGFFRRFTPLKEKFQRYWLNYLPYDIEEDKIKKPKIYESIKKNSLIRVENRDFSDLKDDTKILYVADYDFPRLKDSVDFLRQFNKQFKIIFLYPLVINDEETFRKIYPLLDLTTRRPVINFKFSKDFFQQFYFQSVLFNSSPLEFETNTSLFLQRLLKMILYSKKQNLQLNLTKPSVVAHEVKKQPLLKLLPRLYKWNYSKEDFSFYEFLTKRIDMTEINGLIQTKQKLRFLMKQNPQTFNLETIDFF